MKRLRGILATAALTLALCLTAIAGEINSPPCSTDPGETSGPPCAEQALDSTAAGKIQTPPQSSVDLFAIVETALEMFVGF